MQEYQSIRTAKRLFRESLKEIHEQPEIDAVFSIVIEHLTGYNSTKQFITIDEELAPGVWAKLESVLARLKENEPVQYVLGRSDFYDLTFHVNQHTLIPRQETELLVDLIIKEYREKEVQILDIGTGSGCIAISLKKNLPLASVSALDVSKAALMVASENATLNKVEILFKEHNILDSGPDSLYDVIVSNPPYVKENEKVLMKRNVLEYEPHLALFVPNTDALRFYQAIAKYAGISLKPGGQVWVEINEALGEQTAAVFKAVGFENTQIIKDLNGKNRFVKAW